MVWWRGRYPYRRQHSACSYRCLCFNIFWRCHSRFHRFRLLFIWPHRNCPWFWSFLPGIGNRIIRRYNFRLLCNWYHRFRLCFIRSHGNCSWLWSFLPGIGNRVIRCYCFRLRCYRSYRSGLFLVLLNRNGPWLGILLLPWPGLLLWNLSWSLHFRPVYRLRWRLHRVLSYRGRNGFGLLGIFLGQ